MLCSETNTVKRSHDIRDYEYISIIYALYKVLIMIVNLH